MEAKTIRDNVSGGALTETSLLILIALYTPNHGYGVKQFINSVTDGRVKLGAGTLYGAINTMLEKDWIVSANELIPGSSKKEYIITDSGKYVVMKEQKRLQHILSLIRRVMDDEKKN